MKELTRRRFLAIAGAAVCGSLTAPAFAQSAQPYVWRGVALGAGAEIRLHISDRAAAARLVDLCLKEIARLEQLFSLHADNSAINQLNRDGVLANPDSDFVALLSTAGTIHQRTDGAFDPTVQPLWASLARQHAGDDGRLDDAALPVGFNHVDFTARRVTFARPGMALTLNGIAQGYITDRIADLLRANGVADTLINMGELRALDGRPDGSPWPVHLNGLDGPLVQLRDSALATSAAAGTTFDDAGTASHILDPRTGQTALIDRRVSVEAPTAVVADALSTAFCVMDRSHAAAIAHEFPGARLVGWIAETEGA